VLHCLGSCDFADFFAAHAHTFFDAVVADPYVKDTVAHCFKHLGRDHLRKTARERHTALADAILRHITERELGALEHTGSERARAALGLSEIVFEQLQNTDMFPDVRACLDISAAGDCASCL
jgi:hypothetical protein